MDEPQYTTSCINCAFFVKEYIEDNGGRRLTFSMSASERSFVKNGQLEEIKNYYSYCCHLGQWDEGAAGKIPDLWKPGAFLFQTSCHSFIPFDANKKGKMLFAYKSDLEDKEKTQHENFQRESDQRHLLIAKWSAVAAILAAVAAWGSVIVSCSKSTQ
ncbi:MAG: hypothetical protein AB7E46_02015 [Desulfovibrio sp.]|jgi:hypothetical protein